MEEDVKELIDVTPPEWRLEDLIEAAESGVSWVFLMTVEPEGPGLCRLSPGVQRFFSRSPDEFWHFNTWRTFLTEEEHRRLSQFLMSLPDSNRVFEMECRVQAAQNVTAIMRVAARRSRDLLFGSFKDITTERLAEEGLQRQYQLMMSIFTTAPIPIFLCDERFRIIETNRDGAHFFERESPAQVFGLNLLERIDESDRSKLQNLLATAQETNAEVKVTLRSTLPQPRTKTVASFKVTVIPYQDLSRALIIVNDEIEIQTDRGPDTGRILVVSPNLTTRLQIEKLLAKIDLKAEFFLSIDKIPEQCGADTAVFVVLDDEFPAAAKREAVETLRARCRDSQRHIRLYLLKSADSSDADLESRVDGVLERPLTLATLRRQFSFLIPRKKRS